MGGELIALDANAKLRSKIVRRCIEVTEADGAGDAATGIRASRERSRIAGWKPGGEIGERVIGVRPEARRLVDAEMIDGAVDSEGYEMMAVPRVSRELISQFAAPRRRLELR